MVCHVGSGPHANGEFCYEKAAARNQRDAGHRRSRLRRRLAGAAAAARRGARSRIYLEQLLPRGERWLRLGQKDITDPIELVQDTISGLNGLGLPPTSPLTTTGLSPKGWVLGGQFGCDYQFAGSGWVVGFEGAATGGNLKSQTYVGLPLDPDVTGGLLPGNSALVSARMDFIPSGTFRLGYAWDRVLLYVKGGAAGASDKFEVLGIFTPVSNATPFDFQGLGLRVGWTAGAGVEWAFYENWSVKVEYDYYGFGHSTVLMSESNLGLVGARGRQAERADGQARPERPHVVIEVVRER